MKHIYQRSRNRSILLLTGQIVISILLIVYCIICARNQNGGLDFKIFLFFLLMLYGIYPIGMSISFYLHDADIRIEYDDKSGEICYSDSQRKLNFKHDDIRSMVVHRGYNLMYYTSIELEHEAPIEVSILVPLGELKFYAVKHLKYDVELELFLEMS